MYQARRNLALEPWQVGFKGRRADLGGVERLFRTMKRAYGYRRVRYLGLARDHVQRKAMCAAVDLRRAFALGLARGAEAVRCGPGRA